MQEITGPGTDSNLLVGEGTLQPGAGVAQVPDAELSRRTRVGATADQPARIPCEAGAAHHAHAHLPHQPPQLCHHLAPRMALSGTNIGARC